MDLEALIRIIRKENLGFSYHSFETWLTHMLTKNVYETPEKQIDGKEKLQSNVTSV